MADQLCRHGKQSSPRPLIMRLRRHVVFEWSAFFLVCLTVTTLLPPLSKPAQAQTGAATTTASNSAATAMTQQVVAASQLKLPDDGRLSREVTVDNISDRLQEFLYESRTREIVDEDATTDPDDPVMKSVVEHEQKGFLAASTIQQVLAMAKVTTEMLLSHRSTHLTYGRMAFGNHPRYGLEASSFQNRVDDRNYPMFHALGLTYPKNLFPDFNQFVDAQGKPIPVLDDDGEPVLDDNGMPTHWPEADFSHGVNRKNWLIQLMVLSVWVWAYDREIDLMNFNPRNNAAHLMEVQMRQFQSHLMQHKGFRFLSMPVSRTVPAVHIEPEKFYSLLDYVLDYRPANRAMLRDESGVPTPMLYEMFAALAIYNYMQRKGLMDIDPSEVLYQQAIQTVVLQVFEQDILAELHRGVHTSLTPEQGTVQASERRDSLENTQLRGILFVADELHWRAWRDALLYTNGAIIFLCRRRGFTIGEKIGRTSAAIISSIPVIGEPIAGVVAARDLYTVMLSESDTRISSNPERTIEHYLDLVPLYSSELRMREYLWGRTGFSPEAQAYNLGISDDISVTAPREDSLLRLFETKRLRVEADIRNFRATLALQKTITGVFFATGMLGFLRWSQWAQSLFQGHKLMIAIIVVDIAFAGLSAVKDYFNSLGNLPFLYESVAAVEGAHGDLFSVTTSILQARQQQRMEALVNLKFLGATVLVEFGAMWGLRWWTKRKGIQRLKFLLDHEQHQYDMPIPKKKKGLSKVFNTRPELSNNQRVGSRVHEFLRRQEALHDELQGANNFKGYLQKQEEFAASVGGLHQPSGFAILEAARLHRLHRNATSSSAAVFGRGGYEKFRDSAKRTEETLSARVTSMREGGTGPDDLIEHDAEWIKNRMQDLVPGLHRYYKKRYEILRKELAFQRGGDHQHGLAGDYDDLRTAIQLPDDELALALRYPDQGITDASNGIASFEVYCYRMLINERYGTFASLEDAIIELEVFAKVGHFLRISDRYLSRLAVRHEVRLLASDLANLGEVLNQYLHMVDYSGAALGRWCGSLLGSYWQSMKYYGFFPALRTGIAGGHQFRQLARHFGSVDELMANPFVMQLINPETIALLRFFSNPRRGSVGVMTIVRLSRPWTSRTVGGVSQTDRIIRALARRPNSPIPAVVPTQGAPQHWTRRTWQAFRFGGGKAVSGLKALVGGPAAIVNRVGGSIYGGLYGRSSDWRMVVYTNFGIWIGNTIFEDWARGDAYDMFGGLTWNPLHGFFGIFSEEAGPEAGQVVISNAISTVQSLFFVPWIRGMSMADGRRLTTDWTFYIATAVPFIANDGFGILSSDSRFDESGAMATWSRANIHAQLNAGAFFWKNSGVSRVRDGWDGIYGRHNKWRTAPFHIGFGVIERGFTSYYGLAKMTRPGGYYDQAATAYQDSWAARNFLKTLTPEGWTDELVASIDAGAPVTALVHGEGLDVNLFNGVAPWREFEVIEEPGAEPIAAQDLYELTQTNNEELVKFMGGQMQNLMAAAEVNVDDREPGVASEIQIVPRDQAPPPGNRPAVTLDELDLNVPQDLPIDRRIPIIDPNAPPDAPAAERVLRQVNVREAVLPGLAPTARDSNWQDIIPVLTQLPWFREHAEDFVFLRMQGPVAPITLGAKIYDDQHRNLLNLGQNGLLWNKERGYLYYERLGEYGSSRFVIYEHRFYLDPFSALQDEDELSVHFASPDEIAEARERLLTLGMAFELCLRNETPTDSFANSIEKLQINNYLIELEEGEEVPLEFLDNFELGSFDVMHRFELSGGQPARKLMVDLDRSAIVVDPCLATFDNDWADPNFDWQSAIERSR